MRPAKPNPAGKPSPIPGQLHGLGQLVIEGVIGVTNLVEATHAAITHLPSAIGRPAPTATTGLTGAIYSSVRTVTGWVGSGVDASLTGLAPWLENIGAGAQREANAAAVNGVLGDHLETSHNPLAIPMQFRVFGEPLALDEKSLDTHFPQASSQLLVLVHGLCMNDLQWTQAGHDHGAALASTLGLTPLYLRYNTGRHISTNGAELSSLLSQLVKSWPVPVQEMILLGHSMGGLVVRSALDDGYRHKRAWTRAGVRAVFLGTPHHGAPLERAGSWADMLIGLSPYSAPFMRLGQVRSAGIQDLRHGSLRKADWQHPDAKDVGDPRTPLPLPAPVTAYAIATSRQAQRKGEKLALSGSDGLVQVASALGIHADPAFDLKLPRSRQWVGYGINHLEMLGSQAVYERLAAWLRKPLQAGRTRAVPARPVPSKRLA